jgi:hypothetical protein
LDTWSELSEKYRVPKIYGWPSLSDRRSTEVEEGDRNGFGTVAWDFDLEFVRAEFDVVERGFFQLFRARWVGLLGRWEGTRRGGRTCKLELQEWDPALGVRARRERREFESWWWLDVCRRRGRSSLDWHSFP